MMIITKTDDSEGIIKQDYNTEWHVTNATEFNDN